MAHKFIILSLPRSRSAWLAHFLTYGAKYVIGHDLVIQCDSIEQFVGLFAPDIGLTGTVETGAVLGWPLFRESLPDVQIVTLHRPVAEVMESFARFGIVPDRAEMEARADMLEACAAAPGVMRIDSAELFSVETARKLFETLLPEPFDYEWFEYLTTLNIQINMVDRMRILWERREALATFRAEVAAELKKLPESRQWMI